MRPLLTVAIPNYNGGENLERAIKSCKYVNLSKEDFEILVVDNQSTDDSVERVKRLREEFPNIRLVVNDKNYGRIGNWNRCLDLAKGKYLIYLFSNDEIYKKNKIENTLSLMEKNNIALSIQPFRKIGKDKEFISRNIFKEVKFINSMEFIISHLNKFSFPFAPIQSNIYNLDIINKNGIRFHPKYDLNGDQLFSIEVAIKKDSILFYPAEQIIWKFSKNRFHSKVSISKVIQDDFLLLEHLINLLDLKNTLNPHSVICYAFLRILRNKEWNNSGKTVAIKTVFDKMLSLKGFFFITECAKKLKNKIAGIK